MRDVKILYRLEKQNIVPIRNCLLLNKIKTNRVEYNGGGGGGLVGTWAAELMRHASKMLQYLRIGALLKRVTPEVLAIRQS